MLQHKLVCRESRRERWRGRPSDSFPRALTESLELDRASWCKLTFDGQVVWERVRLEPTWDDLRVIALQLAQELDDLLSVAFRREARVEDAETYNTRVSPASVYA